MKDLFAEERMVSRNKVMHRRQITTPHYHDVYELYYMLDGSTNYVIDNKIYQVEKGNFVFIPKGMIHNTDNQNCKNNERLLVCFGEEIFEGKMQELREQLISLRVIQILETYRSVVEEVLFKIEAEYHQKEKGRELLLEVYIQELLLLICRYRCERKVEIKESDKIIYRVSNYIRKNFESEISLTGLSMEFAISTSFLSRKFRQVTGIGLNQYITLVRISKGEELLRKTKLSITEIAEQCGYNDSNYFTSVFKKIKGMTPIQYRKQKRNKI